MKTERLTIQQMASGILEPDPPPLPEFTPAAICLLETIQEALRWPDGGETKRVLINELVRMLIMINSQPAMKGPGE